jgi:myo-inositol-1(or 4)-monophosphatase
MANHHLEVDLPAILAFCMSLAREAGALILKGSNAMATASDVGEKANSVDLVTEFDVQVEELVKAEIRKTYPTYKL